MNAPFLGLPVDGDIVVNYRCAQRPIEEFAPIMQAVLNDPTISEFGWQQFTPHFNDGDACIFSAGDAWFRTVDDVDEETYELRIENDSPSLGKRVSVWDDEARKYVDLKYEGPDEARFDRCEALYAAISAGEFDDVLINAFGDHAEVTVRKDGIDVEFCSHD